MSMSVGASSSALSYLQSLLQQGTSGAADAASATDPLSVLMQAMSGSTMTPDQTNSATGSTGGAGSCPPFGTGTMAALISLQGQSANSLVAQSPSQLFSKIDTDGDGKINKTEFENALTGAGASTSDADATFAKLDANGDGSTTTTITYADGTKIDMTSPATASNSGQSSNVTGSSSSNSAAGQNNADLLQEMIKLQSQILTAIPSTMSAIA